MALLIGNGHLNQGLDLRYTEKDSADLRDAYRAAGYASGAIWLCTGALANREFIRSAATEMQQRWSQDPASMSNVHFSGHACVAPAGPDGKADVVLALDSCRGARDAGRTLRLSEIRSLFGDAALGASIFVTLDSCLTGGLPGSDAIRGRKGETSPHDVEKARQAIREVGRRIRGANVHIVFACQPGRSAGEVRKGRLEGGLFSRALAEGLTGKRAPAWKDGELTSDEVTPLVSSQIQKLIRQHRLSLDQRPCAIGSGPPISIASEMPEATAPGAGPSRR